MIDLQEASRACALVYQGAWSEGESQGPIAAVEALIRLHQEVSLLVVELAGQADDDGRIASITECLRRLL